MDNETLEQIIALHCDFLETAIQIPYNDAWESNCRCVRVRMKKAVCTLDCILLLHISPYAFGIEPDEPGLKTGGESQHYWCREISFHHGEKTFI